MKNEEITLESMRALAARMAIGAPVLGWQLQDRLNASMNLNGHEGATLPLMGQTLALPATDEQRMAGIGAVYLRKVSPRYWIRVVVA